MKLKCVQTACDNELFTTGSVYEVETEFSDEDHYVVYGEDGCTCAIETGTLKFADYPEYCAFEIVEDSGNDQRESEGLQTKLPSLEQLSEWCQQAEVEVTLTSFGTFNVFDGDTERQCEIDDAENLVQLLQIMSSYKESLKSFGWWG
jgi:hypothetical protein